MPERTTLLQAAQVGVESTPGTAVAANKRLLATSFELQPDLAIGEFRPKGFKFDTLTLPGAEMASGEVDGVLSYSDIIYLLSSVLGTPAAPVQPDAVNSPTVYDWTFEPASTSEDDPTTYTIEVGSTVRAHRAAYGVINELGFSFQRDDEDGVSLEGALFAKKLEDGVTLTASPTDVQPVPVLPQHFTGYLDTTSGGLGTTKLNRLLSVDFSIGARFNPLWVIDASEDSFVAAYEAEPEVSATIMVEANAEGMGLLGIARTGDTRFLRLEAVGATISDDETYKLTFDLAVKVGEVNEFSDEDGIYAIEYELTAVHDATWGKAMSVLARNTLSAL